MTINSPAASLTDLEGDDMRLTAGNMNKSSSQKAHPELLTTYPVMHKQQSKKDTMEQGNQ